MSALNMPMTDLSLQCTCGAVRGILRDVSPSTVFHFVCHCGDCRTFLRHIGRAEDLLTAHGGTPVVHTTPARVTLQAGKDNVGLLRLSPRGLLRFYATCCNTPLGAMLDQPNAPLMSLSRAVLSDDAHNHLGPAIGIRGRSATGDPSTLDAAEKVPLGVVARMAGRMVLRRLQGEARPSPFHHPDGTVIAAPVVLTKEERAAARQD